VAEARGQLGKAEETESTQLEAAHKVEWEDFVPYIGNYKLRKSMYI
jgi:hypothetical protein